MDQSDKLADVGARALEIAVLVPYDRQADYLYVDALGETRAAALAHFTSHLRFDLSLSEIFHMEFAEGFLHFQAADRQPGGTRPCVVPFHKDEPCVQGVAPTEDESRRILALIGKDPSEFTFSAASLEVTDSYIL